MKKQLRSTIKWADTLLHGGMECDWDAACDQLARWIGYFQHERLIHLIVTALFAVLTVLTLIALTLSPGVPYLLLFLLMLSLTIPYVFHYYTLENGTQALYEKMDRMQEKRCHSRIS